MAERLRVAITMGDPAGIGPEVVVKALNHPEVYERCIPVVAGDRAPLEDAIRISNLNLQLNEVKCPDEAKGRFGVVDYIAYNMMGEGEWEYKKHSDKCGEAVFFYITNAIKLAKEKVVAAVITAPINKESLHMAGYKYSGHTEIFADYTNTKDYAMLLASKNLRVIHVSTHVSLREACDRVKKDRIVKVIQLAQQGMQELGCEHPKIVVAGLNPHCSEGGLFGTEEETEIIPAIEETQKMGIDVYGPEPPDTVFVKCESGQYDIVVAMYHDQGHIPLKLHGFVLDGQTKNYKSVNGINCTIGLPIIRASVDHGTAFGKAGEGRASEESMLDAIYAGLKMAEYREKHGMF